jgi:hypothetical protein
MQKKKNKTVSIETSDEKNDTIVEKKVTGKALRYLFRFLIIASILGLSGTSFYYYQQYRKIKISPEVAAQSENKQLVDKISVFMILPEGEEPTIATVSDREKLSEKDFFKKSENGDKILIYTEAKKAILYRPSINKVIEVAPLLMDQETSEISRKKTEKEIEPAIQAEDLKVSIKNGTQSPGLAAKAEIKLVSIDGINIYEKGNTKRNDYQETLVIDLSGENKTIATEIATTIEGEIGTLPNDEIAPKEADILVIIGE